MSFRRRPTAASFTTAIKSLFQSRRARHPRRLGGLTSVERFEERKMLALSVTGIAPLDGSTNVPLTSDLVFTFNENVAKGQGNIYVVRQGTGTTGVAVDVRSANVAISGNQVTVDLPTDLELDNTYSVYIDKVSALGWKLSRTFEDSLAETVEWYRNNRAWWEPLKARAGL